MAIKKKTTKALKTKTVARKPKAAKNRTIAKRALTNKAPMAKKSFDLPSAPITKKQTKAQILAEISSNTGLAKNEVKNMFAALKNLVERSIRGKGYGEIIIPELAIKVRRIQKKATKARMGRNPFTGEEIQIPAKPARKSVKATALKGLKELI